MAADLAAVEARLNAELEASVVRAYERDVAAG
jgi:hypothetical protein